jgi:hypothetical protein
MLNGDNPIYKALKQYIDSAGKPNGAVVKMEVFIDPGRGDIYFKANEVYGRLVIEAGEGHCQISTFSETFERL